MGAVIRNISQRSLFHVRRTSLNQLTLINRSPPPHKLVSRRIHQSSVFSHQFPPRDPNIPYEPRWKPNPLFPPGTYKMIFEKFVETGTKFKVYLSVGWSYYDGTMKLVVGDNGCFCVLEKQRARI